MQVLFGVWYECGTWATGRSGKRPVEGRGIRLPRNGALEGS